MTSIAKLKDRARKLEHKEDWTAAIQAYQEVLEAEEDQDELELELGLYNRIGDLHLRLGQTDDAVSYYETAADKYAESGFFNNAIALCNKALRHRPDRALLYLKLSRLCSKQGFLSDARRWILQYAERQVEVGDDAAAVEGLAEFIDSADDPEVRELLARHLAGQGREAEAVDQLQWAHAAFTERGDPEAARRVADRARELDPAAPFAAEAGAAAVEPDQAGWEMPVGPAPEEWETASEPAPQADWEGGDLETGVIEGLEGFEGHRHEGGPSESDAEIEGLEGLESHRAGDLDQGPADTGGWPGEPEPASAEAEPFESTEGAAPGETEAEDTASAEPLAGESSRDDWGTLGWQPVAEPDDATEERSEETAIGDDAGAGESPGAVEASDEEAAADLDTAPSFGEAAYEEEDGYEEEDVEPLPLLEGAYGSEPDAPGVDDLSSADEGIEEGVDEGFDERPDEGGGVDDGVSQGVEEASGEEEPEPLPLLSGSPEPDTGGTEPGIGWTPSEGTREAEKEPEGEELAAEAQGLEPMDLPELEPTFQGVGGYEAAGGYGPDDVDADAVLERARELVARGLLKEALRELRLISGSTASPAQLEQALRVAKEVTRHDANDVSALQARVEFAAGVAQPGELVAAFLDLADALARLGSETKARAMYERVLDLDPGNAAAREALGATLDEAEEPVDLDSILREMQPGDRPSARDEAADPEFAAMLSQLRARTGPRAGEGDDAGDHYDLGLAFKEMGLIDEAIAEFQTALMGGEERLKVYEELGHCFMLKRQYSVAVKIFNRALRMPREDAAELLGVYYFLGQCHEELGHRADAREAYERVLRIDDSFGDVPSRVARL